MIYLISIEMKTDFDCRLDKKIQFLVPHQLTFTCTQTNCYRDLFLIKKIHKNVNEVISSDIDYLIY